MTPVVSIIVPVYNAEAYLKRCVNSILNQEYMNFELLLIDDGSTDSSGEICEEYAGRDARVRVVHKENSGVSDTRNLAIEMAEGAYLQFVDSDDWLTADATKLMVRAAQENSCDLVITDFYRVVGERVSQKGDIEEDGVLNQEAFAACMMENPSDFYYGVLWNKLYRRDIIERYQLRMDSEISWCEDFMFNLEYIRHAESFYALRTPVYYYLKRKGSLVSQGMSITKTVKMKLMVFEYYNNFYKHVLDEEDYEKNRLQVYRFLVDSAGDGMILPTILSGAKRLGEERSRVCAEAVAGDGILMEAYRERKLLERYLEPAAIQNDLSLLEASLLLLLRQYRQLHSRREMADLLGISRRRLSVALQKLVLKGIIKVEEEKGKEKKSKEKKGMEKKAEERRFTVTLLPAADSILADFEVAEADYNQARLAGFDEAEKARYAELSERVTANIRRVLQ
ncbi:MAG: glycosyltransferase family 2 protein [Lachnospiraceae bacterium]|nr:glycosyltransferase family 2 protein [Lachnospiraceae bacterium]